MNSGRNRAIGLRLIVIFGIITFNVMPCFSQNVGINASGSAPAPSSMLDVSATDKGILIPRVALTGVNTPIPSPVTSLLVYNTSTSGAYPIPGFYYFDGTNWVMIANGGNDWKLTGNAGTVSGTGAGQNFLGTTDSINFKVATNSTTRFEVKANGNMRMTGDFENQELTGATVSWGSAAIADPASTAVTAAAGSASSLWLTTAGLPCPSCNNTYYQDLPATSASAEVIDGSVQSITVNDGSGTANSGVLIMANVSIKVIQNGTLPNVFRYYIWLQRSTDPAFTASATNVHKIEDGVASGITVGGNIGPGTSNTSIIYPDLNLAPGTYYYRLVFQGMLSSSAGQTPSVQDRSMVLLQIKR